MKTFFLTIVIIVMLAILGVVGYASYDYLREKNSLQFDLIPSPTNTASSTDDVNFVSSTNQIVNSTTDTSSWKTYTNDELGYELKYPSDVVFNYGNGTLIIAFPKKTYFHWPLEDEVKLTVIASSTCSGKTIDFDYGNVSTSTITINARTFLKSEGSGVATGNIYSRTTYDIRGNGVCYSLIIDSHGANGAGLYVDDQTLIKKYDGQHLVDINSVQNTIYAILATFEIKKLPEGVLEH